MGDIGAIANGHMESYKAFGRECRRLITNETSSREYNHLKNSYTNGMKKTNLYQYRAVVHVVGRPPGLHHDSKRNMEVGRLEVVAIVEAPLNDSSDYSSGFNLQGIPHWIRIVIGQNITHDEIIENVRSELKARKTDIADALSKGDYHNFIINVLSIVNNAIGSFKKQYSVAPKPTLHMHR